MARNVSQVSLEIISSANLSLLLCETDLKASTHEDEDRRLNLFWLEIGHVLLESSHQIKFKTCLESCVQSFLLFSARFRFLWEFCS